MALVDGRRRIADLPHAGGNGVQPELRGLDVRNLVPLEWAGDAGIGGRADGVGGRHRAVARVLVVVDEDPVSLLLPPLARRELRDPSLDLAGEGERRAPDLGDSVFGLDPDVVVYAP